MGRRILALDQSSRTSGYAIFVEGHLETFGHFTIKDEDIGIRLLKIRQQVETLVNKYDITEAIIEDIQLQTNVSNNVATFKALAEVFGVIYENSAPKYLCYGVPAQNGDNPPKELSQYYQWLPIDSEDENSNGFFMMYQDAVTGKNISVEVI